MPEPTFLKEVIIVLGAAALVAALFERFRLPAVLGFLLAGVNTSGRALHDLLGGTIVVRGRKVQL